MNVFHLASFPPIDPNGSLAIGSQIGHSFYARCSLYELPVHTYTPIKKHLHMDPLSNQPQQSKVEKRG